MAKLSTRNRNKDKYYKDGRPKPANWEYRFEAAKIDGSRNQISKAGFKTKKDAEIAGTKAMAEYNNAGLHFEPSNMSFSDFMDYWFENYVKLNCKYNTQRAYTTVIENHLKPALGIYKLKSLTPLIIQEYVNHKFATGLKKNTLTNICSVLTGSLKYAVVPANLLQNSPAQYIRYPKMPEQTKSEVNRTVISMDDFNRILERFPVGNPFRYALLIGFHTGLRIGEVYGLTWDDIDFYHQTITVNKIMYKRNYDLDTEKTGHPNKKEQYAWYFGSTKTRTSNRTIKIGATLIRELKAYRKMQLENELTYGEYYTQHYIKLETDEKNNTIRRIISLEKSIPTALSTANLVIRKENGAYSSIDSFKYAARVIHYDLGITFNFHSLRHTHATMLIESGVPVKAVQERLGHTNIETTLQTYVHNTKSMESSAVDIFEAMILEQQKAN